MRVVITGATGHLGVYVVDHLVSQGHEVVALSRSGARPAPPWKRPERREVRAARLDITQDDAVEELRTWLRPGPRAETALVHLAAWHPPATARTSAADRERLLATNVYGTMRVLEAARRPSRDAPSPVGCVVYASTFEVYGEPSELPITEEHRTYPLNDYGLTKLSGEHHVAAFGYEEKVRTVSLRMPAIYGPGETTSRALPNFLRAVARGERPVVYGAGEDLRDQLHGRDAALAIELALSSKARGVFNISDGEAHSVREMAQLAMQVAEMEGEPQVQPQAMERRDYVMSIEKARRELGYAPQVKLRVGMEEELGWLRADGDV